MECGEAGEGWDIVGEEDHAMNRFWMPAVIITIAAFVHTAPAQDFKARLAETSSIDDIKSFCSKFDRFGVSHDATYTSGKTKLFLYWIQPRDRDTPLYFWIYASEEKKWKLVLDHPQTIEFADANVTISPTDNTVHLLNKKGETIKTYGIPDSHK